MPDLQKFIGRFARSMSYCPAYGMEPITVHAVDVQHLPLLLDEVAKAAAAETVEAMLQERRATRLFCECCEVHLAEVAIDITKHALDGGGQVTLRLCQRCKETNWSRQKSRPMTEGDAV